MWKHFVEARNSENKCRAFCQFDGCNVSFPFSGSTTQCIAHLKKDHDIENEKAEKNACTKELDDCSKEDYNSLTCLLVMFIITSGNFLN